MSQQSHFLLWSPSDSGVSYVVSNRLFNFYVELHGDHVHCDLTVHIVQTGTVLGGGRSLPTMKHRDFGTCQFRLPIADDEIPSRPPLLRLLQSDGFQAFASGPLDDMAGPIDPARFGALPD